MYSSVAITSRGIEDIEGRRLDRNLSIFRFVKAQFTTSGLVFFGVRCGEINFGYQLALCDFPQGNIHSLFLRPAGFDVRSKTGVQLDHTLGNHVDQNGYARNAKLGLFQQFGIQQFFIYFLYLCPVLSMPCMDARILRILLRGSRGRAFNNE